MERKTRLGIHTFSSNSIVSTTEKSCQSMASDALARESIYVETEGWKIAVNGIYNSMGHQNGAPIKKKRREMKSKKGAKRVQSQTTIRRSEDPNLLWPRQACAVVLSSATPIGLLQSSTHCFD
jgi:hypothetical protein